jgi:uncharacterized protein (TIGR03083 family)
MTSKEESVVMALSADGSTEARRRRSMVDHRDAFGLAITEYRRFADALDGVAPDQWSLPTDCAGWDVQQLTSHVVGMAEMWASLRENAKQMRAAKRAAKTGAVFVDALTALQVRDRTGVEPAELIRRLRAAGPKAARARRRVPSLLRSRTMKPAQPIPGAEQLEWWAFGFLTDTILTRDPWMHRIDLTRAIGQPMQLTADHDARLVADVVDEWLARHGQSVALTLTGRAGGSWTQGAAGQHLEYDALEFCRAVSGRGPAEGLLAVGVPF